MEIEKIMKNKSQIEINVVSLYRVEDSGTRGA